MAAASQRSDRIRQRLKLRDVDILLTVIEVGSMGKAAAALNMSQPAVSKAIASLEHTLGVRLVDRQHQGIEPTVYGRALLDCGAAIFDDLYQGVKNIELLADPAAGEVRIGCNPFLAASFGAAVVDALSRSHPRMVFHLTTAYGPTVYRELLDRNVDLLIARRFHPPADERLQFELLFSDSFVVAAGIKSPWVGRRKLELAELVHEPWILRPSESVSGAVITAAFRASGLDYPRTTVVTDSAEVQISLLASGRFLTIVPESVLKFPSKRSEIAIVPVKLHAAAVPNEIVTLKNRTLSPAAHLFIDRARDIAKQLLERK